VVLVVAEFSTVSYRTIGIGACNDQIGVDVGECRTIGHHAHAYSLLILAVVGLVMAVGAVVGQSRAASWATAGIGVAVLLIALALDAPKLNDSRGLETHFNKVVSHVGNGFRLELLGGVLFLLVGGLAVQRLRVDDEEAGLEGAPPGEGEPDAQGPAEPAEPDAEPEPAPEAYRPRQRERTRQRRPRDSS
jgi:hypothetical protein